MKKVLTIGLMLLACAGFVFAADSDQKEDQLKVSLHVEETTEVEWFTGANPPASDASDWALSDDTKNDSISFTADDLDKDVYAAVKTNSRTAVSMYIYGTGLINGADNNIIIPVEISASEGAKTNSFSTSNANKDCGISFSETLTNNNLRVYSEKITLSISDADFKKASAGDYSATIYLQLSPLA